MAAAIPSVSGDRVQLEQVLLNLVLNGMDATAGVVDRPREVRVCSRVGDPGWVEITVRDTGVGFSPDDRERLFAPFYSTKAKGMGLGLSITRTHRRRARRASLGGAQCGARSNLPRQLPASSKAAAQGAGLLRQCSELVDGDRASVTRHPWSPVGSLAASRRRRKACRSTRGTLPWPPAPGAPRYPRR